jgi:methylenetetrahydrofolate reductase (NADPH)
LWWLYKETEYLLVDCHYLGINNVMALRGDAMKRRTIFCSKNGNNFAVDLVQQIKLLNEENI